MNNPLDGDVLNAGLTLAMEWGENWGRPISGRLKNLHPSLGAKDLSVYETACKNAMNWGLKAIYDLAEKQGANCDETEVRIEIGRQFPWMSKENIGRLISQGFYYAWKDGLLH